MRFGNAVGFHQIPVELRFQGQMAHRATLGMPENKGMAQSIQAVMGQQAVQIGQGGLRWCQPQALADPAEQYLAAHVVIVVRQRSYPVCPGGIVVQKQIRAVKSHVVKTPVAPDDSPDLRGKAGKQLGTEAVMGVAGGHGPTSKCKVLPYSTRLSGI